MIPLKSSNKFSLRHGEGIIPNTEGKRRGQIVGQGLFAIGGNKQANRRK